MHKFWDVPELVLELSELLDQQARSRLIQSSSGFWSIAEHLWHTIPSADSLLKLVSTDWGESNVLDIDRFNLYSPFVKDITSTIDIPSAKKLLRIKDQNNAATLLPSLLHIRVCVESSDSARLYASLPPNLLTLALNFSPNRAVPHSYIVDLVKIPHFTFPFLSSLSILSLQQPGLSEATCDAIASFLNDHARSLQTITLNVAVVVKNAIRVLTTIARLPVLQELRLRAGWTGMFYGTDEHPWPTGYANLRALHVPSSDQAFFRGVSSKLLETLDVKTVIEGLAGISQELEAFARLKVIKVHFFEGPMSFDSIACLGNCHELTALHIELEEEEENEITDEEFATLAESWPELRSLKMETTRGPTLTLRGLECLAEHCPKLQTLHITVDASEVDDTPVECSATHVTDLALRWSLVSTSSIHLIANFIGDMWPNRVQGRPLWEDGMIDEDYTLVCWKEILPLADQRSLEWHRKHQAGV